MLAYRFQLGTLLLLMCASVRVLAAETCGSSERPWVRVVFSAGPDQEPLKWAMLRDLAAGLEPSKIGVCRSGQVSSSEPLAILNCSFSASADGLRVALEVVDPVTNQRIERDIQLAALPADGRSLALAVESEELLRASWAKLRLNAAASAVKTPYPAHPAAVEPRRSARVEWGVVVGARAAAAHYGADQTQYGADAVTLLRLPRRLWLEIAFGWRGMLETPSPHGSVTASAVNADLGLHLPWLRLGDFELGAELSSHFSLIEYGARSAGGARATTARGVAGTGRAGLGITLGLTRSLRSFTTLGAGYPWLSYAAADDRRTVTGASGFEVFASSGFGLAL